MPNPPDKIPDPVLPFGKYRGSLASSVRDVAYLDWLLGIAKEPFKTELQKHLDRRPDWQNYEPGE